MTWENEFASVTIRDFGGGINLELPANEIDDNEATDILNLVFDQDSNLVPRPGVTKLNTTPSAFPSRITSLYPAVFAPSGNTYLIATSGNDIYYESSTGVFTSIKGAATLPSDVFWSFAMLDNKLIGANGAATGSGQLNPIKWTSSGNISQLMDGASNAPRFKYVCVWNNRLFGVSADEPNVIHFSKLGDPENFTSGGGSIEVGADDGDMITAIHPHKGKLMIFKRKRVYQLFPFRNDLAYTDPNGWTVDIYSSNVGCSTFTSVRDVLDDLLFLSDAGLTTLQIAQETGGFETRLISRKIPALSNLQVNSSNMLAASVLSFYSQYWIAIPTSLTPSDNGEVWILDFKRIAEGVVRWVRADGGVVGSSYAVVNKNGKDQLYIGGTNARKNIYRYGDADVYSDAGAAYRKTLKTKAYSRYFQGGPEDALLKKEFNRFGLLFDNLTANTSLTISFRFDKNDGKTKSYGITLAAVLNGGQWDVSLWDVGAFSTETNSEYPFIRAFQGDPGRFAKTLDFTITSNSASQKFLLKEIFYEAKASTRKLVSRV